MFDSFNPGSWFTKPHPLIEKNRQQFHRSDKLKKLSECTFVVFDSELTGLNKHQDEIVSIGAVRIRNLRIELAEPFDEFIQPERKDHTDAVLIHRITPEQLKKARPLEEVMPEFIEFVGDSVLVGHYVGLDMDFLDMATRKLYGGRLANPVVDTMVMAIQYKKAMLEEFHEDESMAHSYNLYDLSKEFGLPDYSVHNSFEDALQAAYLFLYLVRKYNRSTLLNSGKLRNLHELLKAGKVRRKRF